MKRNTFVFFREWWELVELLDEDWQKLKAYETIINYALNGIVPPKEDQEGRLFYSVTRPLIDLSRRKYEESVKRRNEAYKKYIKERNR